MKKYFIHDGHKQLGPFSVTELMERGITKCTPIYTAGLGRYVKAAEIPVLNDAFGKSIDDLKHPGTLPIVEKKRSSFVARMAWAVGVLLIIIIPFIVYKLQADVPDAPLAPTTSATPVKKDTQQLKTTLEQKEASSPLQYLSVHGKMHRNLVGKKIIKGSISNIASVASYKNMEMAITFLSGNQTELQTQHFYVYDFVAPNNKVAFRSVFKAPAETEGFRIQVLSAIAIP